MEYTTTSVNRVAKIKAINQKNKREQYKQIKMLLKTKEN